MTWHDVQGRLSFYNLTWLNCKLTVDKLLGNYIRRLTANIKYRNAIHENIVLYFISQIVNQNQAIYMSMLQFYRFK